MSMHADSSVQLAWAIANTEANLAGETHIHPVHLFLGILKVIDPHFLKQLEGVNLPDDERAKLVEISKHVRQYLEMSIEDVTRLRRSLRGDLREGQPAQVEIHMLHRSDESRAVFQAAMQKIAQGGGTSLSVLDLVEALFQTGSINLAGLKKPKGRPSSRGAQWEVIEKDGKSERRNFAQWFGRNLSRLSAENNLGPFVGREGELRQLIRALSRTTRRHVAILGVPGVGKTSLVEGLASILLTKKAPAAIKHVQVLEIHGSDIAADCAGEAELSKRLMRLFSILHRQPGSILFLDEFPGLFPAHLKPQAALTLLTSILSENRTPCLVASTKKQWDELIDADPSFARQFHILHLENPTSADCRELASVWAKRIAAIQSVQFSEESIAAVLKAAEKNLPKDRAMPDKIVDLLESAATYVKVSSLSSKSGHSEVKAADVQAVLSEHFGIREERAPRSVSEM